MYWVQQSLQNTCLQSFNPTQCCHSSQIMQLASMEAAFREKLVIWHKRINLFLLLALE